MESDISTDPSDYTAYSDLDDESYSDNGYLSNPIKRDSVDNHPTHLHDTYSIITINESIDAVLSSLSINNNNNNNKTTVKSSNPIKSRKRYDDSSDEYTDNESTYCYSSESSYSDHVIESLDDHNDNNNKSKQEVMSRRKKGKYENKIINNDPIECEICDDTFKYHTLYRKHMNEIHKIQRPYICKNCPNNGNQKRYANKAGLDTHIERDHERIRRFKCNLCPKRFYDKQSFQLHQNSHDKGKKFQSIQCSYCNDTFMEHTKYRKHMNEIHKVFQPYICGLCARENAKRYASKAGLKQHIQRYHEGIRRFKCKLCPKAFYEKQTLEKHQRVHDGRKPYQCTYCKLRFSQKHGQRRHIMNIHLKQKKYECNYCGKKFAAGGTMKSHVAAIHNDEKYTRFECRTCHKRFYDKHGYYKHVDTAHRPKDPKKEMIKRGECYYPGCTKKYTANNCAESVKYHLVAVHKDREYAHYECKKCKKLFYDKTSHRKHMKHKHKKHV